MNWIQNGNILAFGKVGVYQNGHIVVFVIESMILCS